jgi:hypothetical protein
MTDIPSTEMETQLRVLMNAAAGDPPRRISVDAVRRGAARRRTATYLAAAAAVVLVGGAGVALAAQPGRSAPAAAAGAAAGGVPRFYIVQTSNGKGVETQVRARATSRVTAKVRCPSASPTVQLDSVTAAARQTFFLVCEDVSQPTYPFTVLSSQVYRFRVTNAGHIRGYAVVRGGALTGLAALSVAVTPDGSELAVSVAPGAAPRGRISPPEVIMINTVTGSHATWHGAPDTPGTIRYPVYDLSLSSNGKKMAFLTQPHCIRKKGSTCKVSGGEQERIVGKASAGGQLSSARVVFRQSSLMRISVGYINDTTMTPDGSLITVAEVSWPFGYVSVVHVSVATGKQVAVVYRMHTGDGFSYRTFSADASGRHFLLDAGPSKASINGWIDNGHLVRLKPAGDSVGWEVW